MHHKAVEFLKKLESILIQNRVLLENHWDIDHLCYRVGTLEKYGELKEEFAGFSRLLIESEVNGRMIATYKLNEPVLYKNWKIDVVELPAPKVGKTTIEGFEHVEVVTDLTFAELEKKFGHVKLDKGGLKKKINQELELCFGEINLKFHPLSLESVIRLEGNKKIWGVLEKSLVFDVLKEFEPLIAGTFPLGLHVEDSDLDVLIRLKDKTEFKNLASRTWGDLPDFKNQESKTDGLDTVVVNFTLDGIPFEIFAQAQDPIKQKAYRHFLIEERLLKHKGGELFEEVLMLKKQGVKTEPAFAQALRLSGDAYDVLLEMQKKPI